MLRKDIPPRQLSEDELKELEEKTAEALDERNWVKEEPKKPSTERVNKYGEQTQQTEINPTGVHPFPLRKP